MTANGVNVPILFLIFNQPDTTQQGFDEIRKAHPGNYLLQRMNHAKIDLPIMNYLENFSKIEFYGAVPENNIFSKTNIYTRLK
jgi:hypothetical protein